MDVALIPAWVVAAIGPATWANWAAACATFFAAWLALKIAQTAQRNQTDAERVKAELVAARIAPLLDRDVRAIQHASSFRSETAPPGLDREVVLMHALRKLHYSIQAEDLTALVPVGDNCAASIARAYSLLKLTSNEMENFIDVREDINLRAAWNGPIAEAQGLLAKAAATCERYATKK